LRATSPTSASRISRHLQSSIRLFELFAALATPNHEFARTATRPSNHRSSSKSSILRKFTRTHLQQRPPSPRTKPREAAVQSPLPPRAVPNGIWRVRKPKCRRGGKVECWRRHGEGGELVHNYDKEKKAPSKSLVCDINRNQRTHAPCSPCAETPRVSHSCVADTIYGRRGARVPGARRSTRPGRRCGGSERRP